MTIHVVGGVYHEYCIHPRWNEIFGSAGRAALAISTLDMPVTLHSYMAPETEATIREKSAWLNSFILCPTPIQGIVGFNYLNDMTSPEIYGRPTTPYPPIKLDEEKVVRFGMLEGDAIVKAKWAVYDPQNGPEGKPFGENGSTADHLAVVLNANEAAHMTGMLDSHPKDIAPKLAAQQNAEVVVIKMGPEGAFVWTSSKTTQVPAYRTNRVWKIGSGDCFVAFFAHAWMHEQKDPSDAAEFASRATAYYCGTQGFPTQQGLTSYDISPVVLSENYGNEKSCQVYLAGPFFDLAQVWLVNIARSHLKSLGLNVFSPYHDVGIGSAGDVVSKDLEGIQESDLILALTDGLDPGTVYEIGYARAQGKPVIVYSERHKGESLKMMEGSGCIICADYTTALYTTLWESVKI